MKKNGFTLVELIAVIAILAILVIMAIPNTLKLYNDSKKKSFTNEAKEIYKTAQNQWIADSMTTSEETEYSKCEEGCENPLKLSGRDNINYYIKIDKSGNVVNYIVSDGTYQYSYSGNGLDISNINDVSEISTLDESEIISFSSDGVKNMATFITKQNLDYITPGDELKIAGENFYVVSSNSSQTILLAKYSLDTVNNEQSLNPTDVSFSDTGYWDGCKYKNTACTSSPEGLLSPYNNGKSYCDDPEGNNCAYVYDSSSIVYNVINKYVRKISSKSGANVDGRLLSVEEVNYLRNANSLTASAIVSSQGRIWLGSAYNKSTMWAYQNNYYNTAWIYSPDGNVFKIKVRPVLIVSTSSL